MAGDGNRAGELQEILWPKVNTTTAPRTAAHDAHTESREMVVCIRGRGSSAGCPPRASRVAREARFTIAARSSSGPMSNPVRRKTVSVSATPNVKARAMPIAPARLLSAGSKRCRVDTCRPDPPSSPATRTRGGRLCHRLCPPFRSSRPPEPDRRGASRSACRRTSTGSCTTFPCSSG